MTDREQFKSAHKHLDLSETKDAWDRPVFAHSHVEAMWSGWKRAIESRVLAERKPVAWRVHPFDYGIGHEGVYAMTMRDEQVLMWERKGWKVEPLFTHPTPDDASDAARYRWLKANCYDTEEAGDGDSFAHPSLVFESDKLAAYSPESLDAAIDAAMKEQKESGE